MKLFTRKKQNWKKPLFWSIGVLLFLIVFLFMTLPLLLSSDSLKPKIEKALFSQIGLEAKIKGNVSFKTFPHPVIRAKKIKLGTGKKAIIIDKIDFHTTLFSLFRAESLLSDLTLHHAEISFESFKDLKSFHIEGLKDLSLKNAFIKIGETVFNDVNLTIYEENNLKFFSLKGNYKDATIGLTGQIHSSKPQQFQGVVHFLGGKTFNLKGNYIPQTNKIIGSFEGSLPIDFPFLKFPQFKNLIPVKTVGEFDTNFSDFNFSNLRLEGNNLSFGGHIFYSKKEGLKLTGQMHKCPLFMTDLKFIENFLLTIPNGDINIEKIKGTCAEIKIKKTNETLKIKKLSVANGKSKIDISGSGVVDEDPSFEGKINLKNEQYKVLGSIFLNKDFIKLYDSKFELNGEKYIGELIFDRKKQKANATLKTSVLKLSEHKFPFDISGDFYAKEIYFGDKIIRNASLKLNIENDKISFQNLIGQINGEPIIADGIFSKNSKKLKIIGGKGKFISSFFPNIKDVNFLRLNFVEESILEIDESSEKTIKISQKGRGESLSIIANLNGNEINGRMTFQSNSISPITKLIPYLKNKIIDDSLMITGRFISKKDYFQMPEFSIRIGANELSGSLSKISLEEKPEWVISLKGDKIILPSFFKLQSFQPDIWDNTEFLNWEKLLNKRVEFSLSLTNLIGTRLGKIFSLDINTKLKPQQFSMRFFQDNGDAKLHFTHEKNKYKGFIHSENYHVSEPWLMQDGIDISFGYLTLESEFETSGKTLYKLFSNMIASFEIKAEDSTLFGLSPYHAIWNAKDTLPNGENAVRSEIIRGLKTGQAPIKKLSCRGVLKKEIATIKYGRFSSNELDNGTFEGKITPLKKKIFVHSRFGLKGLGTSSTDIVWKIEEGFLSPKKTVKITSPYAYDPAYLKKLRKK